MRVLVDNSETLTTRQTRRGLYCIWEVAREGGRTNLVTRWIDPDASVSGADDDTDSHSDDGAGGLCLSASLRAA
jgi:hypothetical protein